MKSIFYLLFIYFCININTFGYYEKLPNGLTLIIDKNNSNNIIEEILIRTGTRFEQKDIIGISDITHKYILNNAYKNLNLVDKLTKSNSKLSSFTSKDYSAFYFKTNKKNSELLFDIFSYILNSTEFYRSEFNNIIYMNKKKLEFVENNNYNFYQYSSDLFYNIAYGKHAYKFPVYGTVPSLNFLSVSMIKNWFKRFYIPNNTVIFISGNVDIDKTRKNIIDKFSFWKKAKLPIQILRVMIVGKTMEKELIMPRMKWIVKNINKTRIKFGYQAPSVFNKDYSALKFIQWLLNKRLKKLNTKTSKVYANYETLADSSFFNISIICNPSEHKNIVMSSRHEIDSIIKNGISKKEFNNVKNKILTKLKKDNNDQEIRMFYKSWYEIMGIGEDFYYKFPVLIKNLTKNKVEYVFKKYFNKKNYILSGFGMK